jgi:nicotinate-nucleotide pyrophosphorylase (carboxylating)
MVSLAHVITENVKKSLAEDLGSGDITALLIEEETLLSAALVCREAAILCGIKWFEQAFQQLDRDINLTWLAHDGDRLQPGQTVCTLTGNARAILGAERTAINFLQTLSATATVTAQYQQLISSADCKILDTRKTIPGLRQAQKYAVRCGGGMNHRIGLFDAFLLKENHLAAAGTIASAVSKARVLKPDALLEVEVEDLDQLQQALDAGVDRVLLDNFSIALLQQAVAITNGQLELEASGNITLQNILQIAQTGVNFISIGALTKDVRAIDFSLRFID